MEKIKNKLCRGCFRELLVSAYGACIKNGKHYYNARCKDCCKNNIPRETNSGHDKKCGHKICSNCNIKKDLTHFNFDNQHNHYRTKCKECTKHSPSPYQYEIDEKNGYKICTKCKTQKDLTHFTKPISRKSYNPHCRECRRKWQLNRLHTNIQLRLKQTMAIRIYHTLKYQGVKKNARTMELIGCDIPVLIKHLETKFQGGMSWNNYGKWHVDHIKPVILFDLRDTNQQKKCFHYTNLQPLWAYDNLSKGDKYQSL